MELENLHVACGRVYAEEYLNIDIAPRGLSFALKENEVVELPKKTNTFVMKVNPESKLPSKENSLNVIYHSHFLEHLPKQTGNAFLHNCFDCLRDGGKMRIVVPDFNLWANNYVNDNSEFFKWYSDNFHKGHNLTKLEIFNRMLYSGHYCMYDFETLSKVLTKIGFKNITSGVWGQSDIIPSINDLETPNSKRKPESLIVESEKLL